MGKPYKAIIEGARLVVCSDCALLGSISWELKTKRPIESGAKPRKALKKRMTVSTKRASLLEPALELVSDFGALIRQARESKGLSPEDLGRRINEKVSQLRKLESHKMPPNHKLAKKLEYALKIKLLIPLSENKIPKKMTVPTKLREITLGDLIKNKERQSEEKE